MMIKALGTLLPSFLGLGDFKYRNFGLQMDRPSPHHTFPRDRPQATNTQGDRPAQAKSWKCDRFQPFLANEIQSASAFPGKSFIDSSMRSASGKSLCVSGGAVSDG
jgi:hypothetical protein